MTLGFRHEALLYDGVDEFITSAGKFLEEGIRAGDSMLVVVNSAKIDLLKSALGAPANLIEFADMTVVGGNPARIIPELRRFVDQASESGSPMRGIGEPFWPERSPAEVAECDHHEALLNLAFGDVPTFSLMCLYDVSTLATEIVGKVGHYHRHVTKGAQRTPSADFYSDQNGGGMFAAPLPPRPTSHSRHEFSVPSLGAFRRYIGQRAVAAGFSSAAGDELVLVANEIATNSVRYGGGSGAAYLWVENGRLVFEIVDAGQITNPLVGRIKPRVDDGTYGLWLANQLCDLVQIRSDSAGTVVRVHQAVR